MSVIDIVCMGAAYFLGGICTGYYFVRHRLQIDLREQGSGGVGARNAGRLLGKPGFIITMIGDALKGALAILLARKMALAEPSVALVFTAVVAGHIWPPLLQFRGGRGIATAVGALLCYDPLLALLLAVSTAMLLLFRRGFVLSGLGGFLLLPLLAGLMKAPGHTLTALAGIAGMILFAHREHIQKAFREAPYRKEA